MGLFLIWNRVLTWYLCCEKREFPLVNTFLSPHSSYRILSVPIDNRYCGLHTPVCCVTDSVLKQLLHLASQVSYLPVLIYKPLYLPNEVLHWLTSLQLLFLSQLLEMNQKDQGFLLFLSANSTCLHIFWHGWQRQQRKLLVLKVCSSVNMLNSSLTVCSSKNICRKIIQVLVCVLYCGIGSLNTGVLKLTWCVWLLCSLFFLAQLGCCHLGSHDISCDPWW